MLLNVVFGQDNPVAFPSLFLSEEEPSELFGGQEQRRWNEKDLLFFQ